MKRLTIAAQRLNVNRPSDIAKIFEETNQAIYIWGKRGVPAKIAVRAEKLLSCSPHWIMTGEGEMCVSHEKSFDAAFMARIIAQLLRALKARNANVKDPVLAAEMVIDLYKANVAAENKNTLVDNVVEFMSINQGEKNAA